MIPPPQIIVVQGFLGAGKTSLIHSFLSEHATGPVAILVEAESEIDPDLRALRGLTGVMERKMDQVIAVPIGRGGAELVKRLAQALTEAGTIQHVILERNFVAPAAELGLSATRTICVVDALDFFHGVLGPASRGSGVAFLSALREQIAAADTLVLNKCDLVSHEDAASVATALSQINPQASILQTAYGEVPLGFWRAPDSPFRSSSLTSSRTETTTTGSTSLKSAPLVVHRPFHPERFWRWFSDDQPGLFRLKGIVWLATRNLLVGGISRTRGQSSCGAAGIWWAALPREEWPTEVEALEEMHRTWREPWGDRRQELLLTGDESALPALLGSLKDCLLTDAEFARPVDEWRALTDPFPEWDVRELE